jgi:WD40 repeat protein
LYPKSHQLLAAGDLAGTLRIWETTAWREQPRPVADLGPEIYGVAFSPNGKYFAACGISRAGGQGGVMLWQLDAHGLALETAVRLTSRSADSLCFSPDSSLLAWLERSGVIHMWDLERGQGRPGPPTTLRMGWQALAFRDRKQLVFVDKHWTSADPIGVPDPVGVPEVWDVDAGQQLFSLAGSEFGVQPDKGTQSSAELKKHDPILPSIRGRFTNARSQHSGQWPPKPGIFSN